jgi:hypothetical protein
MRRVYIVGLNNKQVGTFEDGIERWTLNDWYQFYSWTTERVYNVHRPPHRHPSKSRYIRDWIAEYNKAIQAGAQCWTVWPIEGLTEQHRVPTDEMEIHWPGVLTCQITMMIYHAMLMGINRIDIKGVALNRHEYLYQAPGILKAVEAAREDGIDVNWPQEECIRCNAPRVDWAKIKPMKNYWEK